MLDKIRLLQLGLLIIFLSSCGSDQIEKIKILGEDSSNLQAYASISEIYQSNGGGEIEFIRVRYEDVLQKSNQDFQNDTGLYDIVLNYNFALPNYVNKKWVYELDEINKLSSHGLPLLDGRLFENQWKEVGFFKDRKDPTNIREVKVGYPFAANTMVLVYNKRLVGDNSELGLKVPETWEEFIDIAKRISESSQNNKGVVLQGANGGWLYYEFMNFLFGNGAQVMNKEHGWDSDPETPILLNSDRAIEAANIYLKLKPYNAGDFFSTGAVEQSKRMLQGDVGMAIMWSDYLYDIDNRAKSENLDFGYALIPGNVSMLAGGAFYVNRKSKNPGRAADWISYMLRTKTQIELMKKGLCSPVREVYEHPEIKKIPYATVLKDSLERGVYMLEAQADANLISNSLTRAIQEAWNNESSGAEAMNNAVKYIEQERGRIWEEFQK